MDKKNKIKMLKLIQQGKLPAEALNISHRMCFTRNEAGKYQYQNGMEFTFENLQVVREIRDMKLLTLIIEGESIPYAVYFEELPDKERLEAAGWIVPRFAQSKCKREYADQFVKLIFDPRDIEDIPTDELIERVTFFTETADNIMKL